MKYEIKGRFTGRTLHVADIQASIKREPVKLCRAVLHAVKAGADIRFADLRGADLRGTNLRGARLASADLRGARLDHADLQGVDLSCATLTRVRLKGADLRAACLEGAALFEADLSEADARGADFTDADLRDACINRGKIAGAIFEGADVRDFSAWQMDLPYKETKRLFDRSIREIHCAWGAGKIRDERRQTRKQYDEDRRARGLTRDIPLERVTHCSSSEAGPFPLAWERLATVMLAEWDDEVEDVLPAWILPWRLSRFDGQF